MKDTCKDPDLHGCGLVMSKEGKILKIEKYRRLIKEKEDKIRNAKFAIELYEGYIKELEG